ncbi:MAG: MBL fold metallo-hydrolase [Pseudomonadales bacterium]|nr:MBL fold metallo-hydrolase [Pseudomonadales bacterium]MDP6316070.1 MBL fold metallo-hydrolase [Pseudomonadales bacterium]MDP7316125.1 MBL fold metallo-hydrolase [Pseudomonadales bacterium]MDP7575870.1 MBL fold metallo-hydrolase [Pseudomonadales bacterium]HJP51146.1 MBL fold metallo-hydrolase [Pseudomonadales bacterium]
MKRILLVLTLLTLGSTSSAHDGPAIPEPLPLDQLLSVFGWDFDSAEITAEKVGDNLYVLFGVGGNIAVSIGKDGVLIVDDQFPQIMPKIEAAIGKLGGKGVDFVINTHWHFDHAEGNLTLGPAGTWLVAHANSREMMKNDHIINLVGVSYAQAAYPEDAWPDITYDDTMQFHFNGERVDLLHFGPAHTTGDTATIFRGHNAVHLGDVYNNSGYPFIDAGNGGTLDGVIKFCSETLNQINENTIVIPGHGPVADYQALADYIKMLTTVRSRMNALIENGASLADVYAAKVTKEWDAKQGDNTGFINRSYMSLTHKVVDR